MVEEYHGCNTSPYGLHYKRPKLRCKSIIKILFLCKKKFIYVDCMKPKLYQVPKHLAHFVVDYSNDNKSKFLLVLLIWLNCLQLG